MKWYQFYTTKALCIQAWKTLQNSIWYVVVRTSTQIKQCTQTDHVKTSQIWLEYNLDLITSIATLNLSHNATFTSFADSHVHNFQCFLGRAFRWSLITQKQHAWVKQCFPWVSPDSNKTHLTCLEEGSI